MAFFIYSNLRKLFFFIVLFCSCNNSGELNISTNEKNKNLILNLKKELNQSSVFSKQKKIKVIDSVFYLFKKNNLKDADLLGEICTSYFLINDYNKYLESSKLLLEISKSKGYEKGIAKAYRAIGNYYFHNNVLDSSFYYYSKSEKRYLKIKDQVGYCNVLLKKGIVQYQINDYISAESTISLANSISKRLKDPKLQFSILNQLGLVENQLNQFDLAINFFQSALTIIEENEEYEWNQENSILLSNLGLVYTNLNEYDLAIEYYKKSLNFKNLNLENPILYSNILDNLAISKLLKGESKNVLNLFEEALKIRLKLQKQSDIVVSYVHISQYYEKINDLKNASLYAKKALLITKKTKNPFDVLVTYKQAAKVIKENTIKYSEDYLRISDSIKVIEKKNEDRFARLQLETEEILQQKDSLEQKNRSILNYFIGTIAIGALLFFMRAQRAKSRELLLRQAQQRANEDIYKLIISQQNKLEEGRVLEKTRIAKELHDGVLGRLFGLRLNLDGLNHRDDEAAVQERIRCLEELKIIEQDLREISHELSREKYVLVNNFVAIVNNLFEEQAKINPAKLTTLIDEKVDWDKLSNTTKINLYRILQECLQNINKYANAKNIKVEFRKDKKGNLVLNITDDGDGFEVDKKSKGIGLKNIVTRTHESDGIIEIKSAPGKGTRISITVPLEHKNIKH